MGISEENSDKLQALIGNYLSTNEELKALDTKVENIKFAIHQIMSESELSYFRGDEGYIKKIEFNVDRVSKDKVEELSEKSNMSPIQFTVGEASVLGHVEYFRVMPHKEDE